jgi:hypothetical protein
VKEGFMRKLIADIVSVVTGLLVVLLAVLFALMPH